MAGLRSGGGRINMTRPQQTRGNSSGEAPGMSDGPTKHWSSLPAYIELPRGRHRPAVCSASPGRGPWTVLPLPCARTGQAREPCESIREHRLRYSAYDGVLSIKRNRFVTWNAKKNRRGRFAAAISHRSVRLVSRVYRSGRRPDSPVPHSSPSAESACCPLAVPSHARPSRRCARSRTEV